MQNFEGLSPNLQENYDGFFDFEMKEDGFYLIVFAPRGKGKFVTVEEVVKRLNQKNYKKFNLEAIKQAVDAVRSQEKIEVLLSSHIEAEPVNEQILVEISKDKMFAVITFIPPVNNGALLSYEDVLKQIEAKGVVFGIEKEELKKALDERKPNYKYIIAQGIKPINGENAKLEFHFREHKQIKPKILEDGSVDFFNLDLIENVSKGQTLITLIPPTEGTPGKNVFGAEIPPIKGKNIKLPKGKNTEISADGTQLLASIDGQVIYSNNVVNVYETYEVPNNVDNAVGNIDFVGNVIVKGNVITGFSIVAGGNVEVYGVVEGARIEAQGDIILHRGIQGMSKGYLCSMGNIVAKYIENSTVEAAGDVSSEAIMHSQIKSGGTVKVEGKKGLIVGGVVRARKQVDAKVIGSHMATVTEIEVGIDPALVERYRYLKDELGKTKKEIVKTDQVIELLNKMKEANKLTDAKREMLQKSTRTKVFLNSRLNSIKGEISEIEPQLEEKEDGKVRAYGTIHPGVKITIGTACMYVREELKYCTLYKDRADIRTSSYD
ncbi:FapA family protein [Defluviitalea saccharophila]|uniref:FapA family protein n=1 Tax=Defluviitalea saccharophila TaxID=879970 RepID=A0ABZ2Y4G8_9FIRM